jgi:hypothetical protein
MSLLDVTPVGRRTSGRARCGQADLYGRARARIARITRWPTDDLPSIVRRFRRRGIFIVLAAMSWSTLSMVSPAAQAASYTVWACADGAGRLLSRGEWKEVRVNGNGHFLSSTCGDPDANPGTRILAIATSARGNPPVDSGAGWRIQAAPGTWISGLDLWWSGGIPSGPPLFSSIIGRIEILAQTSIFRVDGNAETGASFGPGVTGGLAYEEGNHWSSPKLSTSGVTLMAWCLSKCDGVPGVGGEVFTTTVAYFEAYRLKTTVEDTTPPAGSVAGLQDGARISVPLAVQATATDVGSGVREISLRVDGRVVQQITPGGSCADVDPSNSDPLEYALMEPCPGQHSGTLTLSPAELADGARHVVSVVATDAAGQESALGTARSALAAPDGFFASARFFNPDLDLLALRTLNGVNAGPANVRLSFVVRNGTRTRFVAQQTVGGSVRPRIGGRLMSAAGVPISAARVWRASAAPSGAWHISGGPLRTSSTGRASGRLPAHGTSRDVRLVYFPYSDSSENVQSPSRHLEVRASTTIQTDQGAYRNGEAADFVGRITTGPVIRRKTVYLQVVVRGRWRTFDTTRADSKGRWRLRYRFTATRRPTVYRFRAVVPTEHAFPWATGHSRAVRVLVTP